MGFAILLRDLCCEIAVAGVARNRLIGNLLPLLFPICFPSSKDRSAFAVVPIKNPPMKFHPFSHTTIWTSKNVNREELR